MQTTIYTFLFFLSGIAGLIYESIWTQYLKLFLGHAAYAQTLVLCIYMGGMAVGAWGAGYFISRRGNPLRVFAIAEILLGAAALVFHPVFIWYQNFSFNELFPFLGNAITITLCKWLCSTLLILPQTILLGATFPLMASGFIRRFNAASGHSIALLYFANTLGAATGVLASGFFLVERIGLQGTVITAGCIDIFVGTAVLILLRQYLTANSGIAVNVSDVSPAVYSDSDDISSMQKKILLAVAGITALSSFMYEIGWIRMLSLVLGSSTHSFELMLSTFILGMALGSFFIRKYIDTVDIKKSLILAQAIMGAASLISVLLYSNMFYLMKFIMSGLKNNDAGYLFFNCAGDLICMIIMLPATICAGMVLPLIIHFFYRQHSGETWLSRIYSINTAGSIAGILISVLLLPLIGVRLLVTLGGVIDIGVALVFAGSFNYAPEGRLRRFLPAFSIMVIVFSVSLGRTDPSLAASGVFRNGTITKNMRMVSHKDGRTATVSLYKNNSNMVLSTNGKPDAAINIKGGICGDEYTMALLAVLPMSMTHDSSTAAIIGLGSGMTAHYLLHDTTLVHLDIIEIEPEIASAARKIGRKVEKAFTDHRSELHIDDAKSFFSSSSNKFDIIISEPSNPWVSGVSGLFSTEFFSRIKLHLSDSGILVQWFHQYESDISIVSSIFGALEKNFPSYMVFDAGSDCIVIASKDPDEKFIFLRDVFKNHDLAAEMHPMGIYSLDDLSALKTVNAKTMHHVVSIFKAPPNSDYHPFVDLNAVKFRYIDRYIDELDTLVQYIVPVKKIIESDTGFVNLSDRDCKAELSNLTPFYTAKKIYRDLTETHACSSDSANEYSSVVLLIDYFSSESPCVSFDLVFSTIVELLQKTLPWLSGSEMNHLWKNVSERCVPYITTENDSLWMSYFEALCTYDFERLEITSRNLLPERGLIDDDYVNRMLLTSLCIASVKNGNNLSDAYYNRFKSRSSPGLMLTLCKNLQSATIRTAVH